jgi:hypothetical protein
MDPEVTLDNNRQRHEEIVDHITGDEDDTTVDDL